MMRNIFDGFQSDLTYLQKIGADEMSQATQALEDLVQEFHYKLKERRFQDERLNLATSKLRDYLDLRQTATGVGEPAAFTVLAEQFRRLRVASQVFAMLEVAAHQRQGNQSDAAQQQVDRLDRLIASCYLPLLNTGLQEQLKIPANAILGLFLEDQFLARPGTPVPYIVVPACLRRLPWAWLGVTHEVGHHVYVQLAMLRDELDIIASEALNRSGLSFAVQQAWFRYLEEVFSDLYGIVLMGAAYINSQQAVFLYDSVTQKRTRRASPMTPWLNGKDTKHPGLAIRGLMGLYAYQQLGGHFAEDDPLLQWESKIVESVMKTAANTKSDVQTPSNGNSQPEDEFSQMKNAMTMVVDAVLRTPLQALKGRCLADLVDFKRDEGIRAMLTQRMGEEPSLSGEAEALSFVNTRLSQDGAGNQVHPDEMIRFWVAAQRLARFGRHS